MESVEGELIHLDFEIAKLVDPTLAKNAFIFIDSIRNYSSLYFLVVNLQSNQEIRNSQKYFRTWL